MSKKNGAKKSPRKDSGLKEISDNSDIVKAAELNKNLEVEIILAKHPERINDQDTRTGMTALHWAGGNRNSSLAKLLFSQEKPKVNPFLKDKFGRYAFDMANSTGDQNIVQLFLENSMDGDFLEAIAAPNIEID